jgi:hypothetical protein
MMNTSPLRLSRTRPSDAAPATDRRSSALVTPGTLPACRHIVGFSCRTSQSISSLQVNQHGPDQRIVLGARNHRGLRECRQKLPAAVCNGLNQQFVEFVILECDQAGLVSLSLQRAGALQLFGAQSFWRTIEVSSQKDPSHPRVHLMMFLQIGHRPSAMQRTEYRANCVPSLTIRS